MEQVKMSDIQYSEKVCETCQAYTPHVLYPSITTGEEVWSCEYCGSEFTEKK